MSAFPSTDSKPVSEKDEYVSGATSEHEDANESLSTDAKPASDKEQPFSGGASQNQDGDDGSNEDYATGFAFAAIYGAVLLTTFLISVDNVSHHGRQLTTFSPIPTN